MKYCKAKIKPTATYKDLANITPWVMQLLIAWFMVRAISRHGIL
jgi:hypothetical protein